jgi:uncharacterized protein RhaS with RHS repeats
MASLTDDNGNLTEWTYDVQGRKLTETKGINAASGSDGTTIMWAYNTDGTMNRQIREDGSELYYVYDSAKRLISVTSKTGTPLRNFAYSASGQRTMTWDTNTTESASADDVSALFVHDSLGRTVEEALTIGDGTARVVSSSYDYETDASNNALARRTLVYPNGRAVVSLTDGLGRLRKVCDAGDSANPIARYDYMVRASCVGRCRTASTWICVMVLAHGMTPLAKPRAGHM